MDEGSGVAMSCGVGRCSLDLALLWLWHRPAAAALVQPLAWELPYATSAALKDQKTKKKKKRKKGFLDHTFYPGAAVLPNDISDMQKEWRRKIS